MSAAVTGKELPVCPYVDNDDQRCAEHLTLANLFSAFTHCADDYAECPIYRERIVHGCRYEGQTAAETLFALS
jgi:hypothetical protein